MKLLLLLSAFILYANSSEEMHARLERFQAMTPEKQQRIREIHHRFMSLPTTEREQILKNFAQFQELKLGEQRERLQQLFRKRFKK